MYPPTSTGIIRGNLPAPAYYQCCGIIRGNSQKSLAVLATVGAANRVLRTIAPIARADMTQQEREGSRISAKGVKLRIGARGATDLGGKGTQTRLMLVIAARPFDVVGCK